MGAPSETRAMLPFLALVEPLEERLALERKVGSHSTMVDCLLRLRDRLGLINLTASTGSMPTMHLTTGKLLRPSNLADIHYRLA